MSVTDPGGPRRPGSRGLHRARSDSTRGLLLATAERLFAEHGIAPVSSRQVAEAAGQANTSAVAYHFGTRTDLVLAVARAHAEPMDRQRRGMVESALGSTDLHDHVECLVRPYTDHLARLGRPTWCARFALQVSADPALREVVVWENLAAPAMQRALRAVAGLVPEIPNPVSGLRSQMIRSAILHTCAEREQALAADPGIDAARSWTATGDALVDALVGLLAAPVRATADSARHATPPGAVGRATAPGAPGPASPG